MTSETRGVQAKKTPILASPELRELPGPKPRALRASRRSARKVVCLGTARLNTSPSGRDWLAVRRLRRPAPTFAVSPVRHFGGTRAGLSGARYGAYVLLGFT